MKKSVRSGAIVFLCITIILMTIGFVVLAISFDKQKNKANTFQVGFTNIKKLTSVKGGVNEPKAKLDIIESNKIIDMDFTLFSENDELVYEVSLKNTGTMSAKIVDIIMTPDYIDEYSNSIEPVSLKVTSLKGKKINPDEELKFKIDIMYKPSAIKQEKNVKCKLALILDGE